MDLDFALTREVRLRFDIYWEVFHLSMGILDQL